MVVIKNASMPRLIHHTYFVFGLKNKYIAWLLRTLSHHALVYLRTRTECYNGKPFILFAFVIWIVVVQPTLFLFTIGITARIWCIQNDSTQMSPRCFCENPYKIVAPSVKRVRSVRERIRFSSLSLVLPDRSIIILI